MRDHALDEHESLKLFTSDLEGIKMGDEGYDEKLHQLMEVGSGFCMATCSCVFDRFWGRNMCLASCPAALSCSWCCGQTFLEHIHEEEHRMMPALRWGVLAAACS